MLRGENEFPAVTTKSLAWKGVVSELLWFLEGSSDERRLAEIRFNKKIVTYVRKFDEFYKAEEFHQDYYVENFINYLRYKKGCKRVKTLEKIWN